MRSKWALILCTMMIILILCGGSTANAQLSEPEALNPIQNINHDPIAYPFQYTTFLKNKDIPFLLTRAGISIENVLLTNNIKSSIFPLSAGDYQWHTFYGSTNNDAGRDIAVDGSGNIYIIGYSSVAWNGPSGQEPIHTHSGGYDIMLLKLDNSGAYQWHTFYGSADNDYGHGIVLDAHESIYITGQSGGSWNGPSDQLPFHAYNGTNDITVLKLDHAGAYQWHTFYGSSDSDYGFAIALDNKEGVYISGFSRITWNGPSDQPPLHAYSENGDVIVIKLDNSGTYQWHTFYGSTDVDYGYGIASDNDGNVYTTGYSDESWNGPSDQLPLHAFNASVDCVVFKLNSSGAYQWHTFYGGTSYDNGFAIELDGNGGVYITGNSGGAWNGPEGQSPLHTYNASSDIMVFKLNSSGIYQWHTFYGSANNDVGSDIRVDSQGNVYIAIDYSATVVGYGDVMVVKLDGSGTFLWDTIYASANSFTNGITTDRHGGTYITGQSFTTWNGSEGQLPLHSFSGYTDIMALKLHESGVGYSVFLPILVK